MRLGIREWDGTFYFPFIMISGWTYRYKLYLFEAMLTSIIDKRLYVLLFIVSLFSVSHNLFGNGLYDFTESIRIEEVKIPMADGIKLAADLYMPADKSNYNRFPVILEYLPYRKDEGRGNRYSLFSHFVKQGYIVA